MTLGFRGIERTEAESSLRMIAGRAVPRTLRKGPGVQVTVEVDQERQRPFLLAVDGEIKDVVPLPPSNIQGRPHPWGGLWHFEANRLPTSSSSRTFGEPQAIGRLHRDHGYRCEIRLGW